MPTSRCSAEQDATRLFIDALRACLGLAPLYGVETESVYVEELAVPMTGFPSEGRQGGASVRHEVRSASVEEAARERVRAMPAPRMALRRRWDWNKDKPEAAE